MVLSGIDQRRFPKQRAFLRLGKLENSHAQSEDSRDSKDESAIV